MMRMQKVLWTKGMSLTPQHLQAQDRFFAESLWFALSALAPFPWGFSRLQLSHDAISKGTFSLVSASGIFRDGLSFDMPAADPLPPPRPLDEHWKPDQRALDIYLGVPDYRPDGLNVATSEQERGTRYVAVPVRCRDETTGTGERPIQVTSKNIRLLVQGESLEGHSVLRIARVERISGDRVRVDAGVAPPLLNIAASEQILQQLRGLVEILFAKSNALSGSRRQRNQGLADFGLSDIANFWLLYTVNTYLPHLRHLQETASGHPRELYEVMATLAGALTSFSPAGTAPAIIPYTHADPGAWFPPLDDLLRQLLGTVVPERTVTLPLRVAAPFVHTAVIDQDRYLEAPELYLAVRASMPQEELIREVPRSLKISSSDHLERLYRHALPGVAVRKVSHPPSSLPIKLDYQYFQLDARGEHWEAIRRSRTLAVYAPAEFPEAQMELVIMLPAEPR
jgi:type VI secretion system protein ImpJ